MIDKDAKWVINMIKRAKNKKLMRLDLLPFCRNKWPKIMERLDFRPLEIFLKEEILDDA